MKARKDGVMRLVCAPYLGFNETGPMKARKVTDALDPEEAAPRFNETGPMKARKAGITQCRFPLMSCFNETGPMKARKVASGCERASVIQQLQ